MERKTTASIIKLFPTRSHTVVAQIQKIKSIPNAKVSKRQPRPPIANNHKIAPKPARTKPIDLIMWRDPSKSTFIFGLGMFVIISTSYTTDINISLISIIFYAGLVYLAAIFLFSSISSRTPINIEYTREEYVLGEEEASWLLNLILPYINEFLSNIKALFFSDIATTMKVSTSLSLPLPLLLLQYWYHHCYSC